MQMPQIRFETRSKPVPHADAAQMRVVDHIAVEDFGLGILQMIENAGRILSLQAIGLEARTVFFFLSAKLADNLDLI